MFICRPWAEVTSVPVDPRIHVELTPTVAPFVARYSLNLVLKRWYRTVVSPGSLVLVGALYQITELNVHNPEIPEYIFGF